LGAFVTSANLAIRNFHDNAFLQFPERLSVILHFCNLVDFAFLLLWLIVILVTVIMLYMLYMLLLCLTAFLL